MTNISKVKLSKEDVLVVELDENIPQCEVKGISRRIENVLGKRNPVLIVTKDTELTILDRKNNNSLAKEDNCR